MVILVQPALTSFGLTTKTRIRTLVGHPESGPETFDVSKFESATAYDQNKQTVPVEINIQDGISVDSQGDCSADCLMTMGTGSRSRRMIGNISHQAEAIEYEDVTYLKYTKGVLSGLNRFHSRLAFHWNYALQNPFEVTVEALPIQVLYEGNLIKDVLVEYLGETKRKWTGIAHPIGEGGLQVIEASYTSPTAMSPSVSYATSFTAEPVPEPSALLSGHSV